MTDPRQVLEHEAEVALDEARARIREAIEQATREVLAEVAAGAEDALRAEAAGTATSEARIMRAEAARVFDVPMSTLRGMERRGAIHPRRKGGRIMLDPQEVADVLGVEVPEALRG